MGINTLLRSVVAAAAVGVMSASAALAVSVSYFDGNECGAGGFGSCTAGGSPTIIKFAGGSFVLDEINDSLFPSIDGSEFSFNVTEWKDGTEAIAGTWSYTPGTGDPMITAYAVKAAPGYNLFTDLSPGEALGGSWYTPDRKEISHITFFDTDGIAPVPIPAGGLLLLTGLGAIGLMRRRKTT